jgi:Flp pilus assembly protein TadD
MASWTRAGYASVDLRIQARTQFLACAEALQEAQQAVALAPDSAGVNAQMGNVLDALGRREEARPYYATALRLALTKQPEFQRSLVAPLEQRLAAEDDRAQKGHP